MSGLRKHLIAGLSFPGLVDSKHAYASEGKNTKKNINSVVDIPFLECRVDFTS